MSAQKRNSHSFIVWILYYAMAVTPVQLAKRAFVRVLLAFAAQYVVPVTVNRESRDKDVMAAFRAVAKRAHPDKGGNTQDTQTLHAAKDAWQEAVTVGHPLRRDFLAQLGSKKEAPTPPLETFNEPS